MTRSTLPVIIAAAWLISAPGTLAAAKLPDLQKSEDLKRLDWQEPAAAVLASDQANDENSMRSWLFLLEQVYFLNQPRGDARLDRARDALMTQLGIDPAKWAIEGDKLESVVRKKIAAAAAQIKASAIVKALSAAQLKLLLDAVHTQRLKENAWLANYRQILAAGEQRLAIETEQGRLASYLWVIFLGIGLFLAFSGYLLWEIRKLAAQIKATD